MVFLECFGLVPGAQKHHGEPRKKRVLKKIGMNFEKKVKKRVTQKNGKKKPKNLAFFVGFEGLVEMRFVQVQEGKKAIVHGSVLY